MIRDRQDASSVYSTMTTSLIRWKWNAIRAAFWRRVYRRHAFAGLLRESVLDMRRYARAADLAMQGKRREHVEGAIIRLYHVIEKGLAMPTFKPRFAEPMVKRLVRFLEQWETFAPPDDDQEPNVQILAARATLIAYAKKHQEIGSDISDVIPSDWIRHHESTPPGYGGVMPLQACDKADFHGFRNVVERRSSVRDYDPLRIPSRELIEEAISLAIRSPSVCNRQTWRVHAFEGKEAHAVLALHDGNRGFGGMVPMVLVVTTDMRYFVRIIERYQPWIDGGMFAMTLLLSLHALGLATVPLHWSVDNQQDASFRKKAGIPEHERIMMLIACGYARDGAMVAKSMRYPAKHFIRWEPADREQA